MKDVCEITVKVECSYQELHDILKSLGFNIKLKGQIDDIYLLPNSINYKDYEYLELSKYFVIVRDWKNIKKELLYKNKEYDKLGNILKEGKTECIISDINDGIKFLKSIGYYKFINISDEYIVYSNGNMELCCQLVNNKYLFIEYEGFNNESIDYLKNKLNSLNLPIDKSNYFVKKAEIIMKEVLK